MRGVSRARELSTDTHLEQIIACHLQLGVSEINDEQARYVRQVCGAHQPG